MAKQAFFDVFYYTNFALTLVLMILQLLFNLIVAYKNRTGSKFKFVDKVTWLFITSDLLAFPQFVS